MRTWFAPILLLVSACVTDKPINFQCPRITEFSVPVPVTPGGPIPGAVGNSLDTIFAQTIGRSRVGAIAPGATNIIVLSGGGKWGAYGAGLMEQWSRQGSTGFPRPSFDIVTGISTGALQSTFVFLGSSRDGGLVQAYAVSQQTPDLTTWVATAKGHGCPDPDNDDEDIFNPQFMRCLIIAGRNSWTEGLPWERYPAQRP